MSDLDQTEVLVLGSGIAGCTVALSLADNGIPVTLVSRASEPTESNTFYAQGGIVYPGSSDDPARLVEDIVRAGAGHSNPTAAAILAAEGRAAVDRILIERVGVAFDREDDGRPALALEGGHSIPRIAHVADATGREIETALLRAVQRHGAIQLLTGHTAIDLLTPSHHGLNRLSVYEPRRVVGAYLLEQASGRVKRCLGRCTVLATGGLGQLYLRTSNPAGARGDGLAMAFRCGARVINAEFVQFHPTTFHQEGAPHFLISEAVRGAGARLVDAAGEPFMQRYDAEWRDLAPRDVVARSIRQEMLARDVPNVFLDLASHLPPDEIRERFPNILRSCAAHGVDITREPIPVVPAAHYSCGGVWVDEFGRSTVDGLYVVGEAGCTGVHGANRLASTSLLEALVWGIRAARHLRLHLNDAPRHDPDDIPSWLETGTMAPDPALVGQDMISIQHIMWNYVGLVRSTRRLRRAIHDLRHLETEIEDFYHNAKVTDDLVGVRNAVRAALLVALAAWENRRSMGCHFRTDP